MVTTASHQPAFLPWPGFWAKFVAADVFILSASVAWTKDSFLNRTRWNDAWVTVPVRVRQGDPILSGRIGEDRDRLAGVQRTIASLEGMTRRYPYAFRFEPVIRMVRRAEAGDSISALNVTLIREIGRMLAPATRVVTDTVLPDLHATKTERLVARVLRFAPRTEVYLMGAGATDYVERSELPFACRVQDPSRFDHEESIIDVLGRESDPVAYLTRMGGWR